MMSSRLNVFQRLVRQWDALHPYNAAQILKLTGTPNLELLRGAWNDALRSLGLGRVRVEGKYFRYECLNGQANQYGVKLVRAGVGLDEYMGEQLNRAFDDEGEPPFRPFVLVENGFYYAGVVYHHWVADSVSIRTVLQEWFARAFDPAAARRAPVRLADRGYWRFFSFAESGMVGKGILQAARWASSLRHAKRLDTAEPADYTVKFAMRQLPVGWIETVHAAARARGVTINDLFLAGMALVCEQHVPLRQRPRRNSVALGSIVDLRPYAEGEPDDAFGLLLGFTNVICNPRELRQPEELVQSISRQIAEQKMRGIPQVSAVRMAAGVAAGHVLGLKMMPRFYMKHMPMAGGISNVNMNRSWAKQYHPAPLLDYIRVSPTGPLMPLVFATTTLGPGFHMAMTYRPSLVKEDRVDGMAGTFREFLNGLASS